MSSSSRIPSLDGLRALSVLIVFISHANFYSMSFDDINNFFDNRPSFLPPARFGVTVFFFISGYIITTLMRKEFERSNDVSFRNFYLRRVYRIFPPLYIVLLLAALLTWAGLLKNSVEWQGVTAQFLHFTNYYALLFTKQHFLQGTDLLWSLAVEEHFYLGFPLLFIFLARRVDYRQMAFILACICLAVLVWRCYLYFGLNVRSNWAFISTDSRIDSILYGCMLGVWMNPAMDEPLIKSEAGQRIVLTIALIAIVASLGYKADVFQKTIMFTVQGIALFAVVASAIRHPQWLIFRWLNWGPIVYIGLISYTFYLSHAIALRIALKYTDSKWLAFGLAFAGTMTFCALMYRFIETPLAKKRAAASITYRQQSTNQ